MAFLAAEKENQQLEDLPQANSGRVAVFLSERKKSITENFAYWKLRSLFLSWFDAFFSLSANALHDFYAGIIDPFIFIH